MCDLNGTDGGLEALRCLTHATIVSSAIPALSVISLVLVVGAVGNILVLLTYYNKLGNSSTNFFIFSLAIIDIISTCFGIPISFYTLLHPYTYSQALLCKFHSFVLFTSDMTSGFIIVCISFDRYMRIARPHRGMSRVRARALVIGAAICTSILCSMAFYVYGLKKTVLHEEPLLVGYSCSVSEEAKTTKWPLIFSTIVLTCFFAGTCVLLIVYVRLGLHVRRWSEQRRHSSQSRPLGLNANSEESSSTRGDSSEKSDSKSNRDGYDPESKKNFVVLLNVSLRNQDGTTQFSSLDRKGTYQPEQHPSGYSTLPLAKPARATKPKPPPPPPPRRKSSMPSIYTIKRRMSLSKTTVMFISATVVFILCHIPYICVKITSVVVPGIRMTMNHDELGIYTLATYSFVFTYAMNPIIYSFMNPRFRDSCKTILKSAAARFCNSR